MTFTSATFSGHVKNIGHVENSYRCKCCDKCIEEEIFSQDQSGGKGKEKGKHFLTAGVIMGRNRNPIEISPVRPIKI